MGAPVYAELLAHPKATESFVNGFLADTGIDVDFDFQQSVWLEAGRRFRGLAEQRRGNRRPQAAKSDCSPLAHSLEDCGVP